MTVSRKSVMNFYYRILVSIFLIMALFFAPIQIKEACAHRKKVSGTCKVLSQLGRAGLVSRGIRRS